MSWGEVRALVAAFRDEWGTRTHAASRGWSFPMSWAEYLLQLDVLQFANLHRDRKKAPNPFELPWPWPAATDVTPEEREALAEQLEARSAMRDR